MIKSNRSLLNPLSWVYLSLLISPPALQFTLKMFHTLQLKFRILSSLLLNKWYILTGSQLRSWGLCTLVGAGTGVSEVLTSDTKFKGDPKNSVMQKKNIYFLLW